MAAERARDAQRRTKAWLATRTPDELAWYICWLEQGLLFKKSYWADAERNDWLDAHGPERDR